MGKSRKSIGSAPRRLKAIFRRSRKASTQEDRAKATSLLNARNEAARQPQLNLQIAEAYLAGTDAGVSTRTRQTPSTPSLNPRAGHSDIMSIQADGQLNLLLTTVLSTLSDTSVPRSKRHVWGQVLTLASNTLYRLVGHLSGLFTSPPAISSASFCHN